MKRCFVCNHELTGGVRVWRQYAKRSLFGRDGRGGEAQEGYSYRCEYDCTLDRVHAEALAVNAVFDRFVKGE